MVGQSAGGQMMPGCMKTEIPPKTRPGLAFSGSGRNRISRCRDMSCLTLTSDCEDAPCKHIVTFTVRMLVFTIRMVMAVNASPRSSVTRPVRRHSAQPPGRWLSPADRSESIRDKPR